MPAAALQQLKADAWASLRRFPFVMGAAFVAAGAGMVAAGGTDPDSPVFRLFLVAALGLPLLLALALLAERRGQPPLGWQGFGLLLLAVFYLAWPGWVGPVGQQRYFQFSVGFHLLVACLPYLRVADRNGFWQYNRILFQRFLTAALFSFVLFLGLAVALLAIDHLLGVELDEEIYLRLWLVIALVFNTWFFLGGVPRDLAALEARTEYPVGLKVFAQYILTPIVAVYLVILTVYLGRIVVTTTWPSGWIGYLVSSVAVVGILAFLLVYPIRERAENRWIVTYGRAFFVALFPSIVMLLLAISQRIGQYGVTEKRYFVVVLALWLAGIAAFYTLRPRAHIKVIPISLCLVAFLTAAGPWSAYAVSRRSQTARLEALLEANGLLAGGLVRPASGAVPFDAQREIGAVLRYLVGTHDTTSIAPWFGDRLSGIDSTTTDSRWRDTDARVARLMASMGLEYVRAWQTVRSASFSYQAEREGDVTRIAGFDYALHGDWITPRTVRIDERVLWFRYDPTATTFRVLGEGGAILLEMPLRDLIETVRDHSRRHAIVDGRIPAELMQFQTERDGLRALIVIQFFSGSEDEGRVRLSALNGDLYLAWR